MCAKKKNFFRVTDEGQVLPDLLEHLINHLLLGFNWLPRNNVQIWRIFLYSRIVLIKQDKPITEVQTLIKICQLK